MKLFISYTWHDRAEADHICQLCDALAVQYFRDEKDIKFGDSISVTVGRGIQDCTDFLVILSPATVKSWWVPFELGRATERSLRILPYLTHSQLDLPIYLSDKLRACGIDDLRKKLTQLLAAPPERRIVVSSTIDRLSDFKRRFDECDLETALDILMEGEDILIRIVGEERYNSYHFLYMHILKELAEGGLAEQKNDEKSAAKHRHMAEELLKGLKTRIRGLDANA